MKTCHIVLTLFFLFEAGLSMPSSLGVSCQDHPGFFEGLKPVLVKSWHILYDVRTVPGMYIVGHQHHRYAPIANPDSLAYDRLDWFWVGKSGPARENYVRLSLTRSAKVFMLVPFDRRRTGPRPFLRGWKTEGIVKLAKGAKTPMHWGIYQDSTKGVGGMMYMFSRETDGDVLLPNMRWIEQRAKNIVVSGDWLVMLSEADGTAPVLQYPAKPPGVSDPIMPNARCPDELHDLWVTDNTDERDEDTKGMKWKTWHPQWDPCYWCGYDHEHGSSPKQLMGYEPKFHYTAWKNGREGESHEGYKGFVFRYESLFVYLMVHMQTSNVKRVSVRHHTILLAVTDAETKELLMEITHKADFGFASVRGKNGKAMPLTPAERRLHDALRANGGARKLRTINVIDLARLNPAYAYKMPRTQIRRGIYETWTTIPMCAGEGREGSVTFDVITAASGIKRATTIKPERLTLGYYRSGKFYRQTGSARLVRVSGFSAGEDLCCFKLADVHGQRYDDGSFYTDPFGGSLRGGAGANTVRQFVKPGFNMKISGRYGPVESWTGLYEENVFGGIVNYGYSINPDVN